MAFKLPRALSVLEETFAMHLMQARLPSLPVREYQFHPERKFRFDFAWPEQKLAVEINGGIYGGRHTRPEGYSRDLEKLNLAILSGWRVLQFTAKQINSLEAIKQTREALNG